MIIKIRFGLMDMLYNVFILGWDVEIPCMFWFISEDELHEESYINIMDNSLKTCLSILNKNDLR